MDELKRSTGASVHPLHDQSYVDSANKNVRGGYMRVAGRRTGRTTCIALRVIADAISRPGQVIPFYDHYQETPAGDQNLSLVIDGIISRLKLRKLRIIKEGRRFSILFGERQ